MSLGGPGTMTAEDWVHPDGDIVVVDPVVGPTLCVTHYICTCSYAEHEARRKVWVS